MPLYLSILVFSFSLPLILSFDRKVRFYKLWFTLFPSLVIIGSIYIIADILFVKYGIWGFNPAYHTDIVIAGLPLEEWLFFILIPYACIFIHFVFIYYYPNLMLSNRFSRILSITLIITLILVLIFNYDKVYTVFNFSILILALIAALFDRSQLLNKYYISFLIMLIPFFITNSILTGTFIPGEVVWYNNSETLGIRLLTVPVEDAGYAFSLILLNLLLLGRLQKIYANLKR